MIEIPSSGNYLEELKFKEERVRIANNTVEIRTQCLSNTDYYLQQELLD
jgi:hypothetical protein